MGSQIILVTPGVLVSTSKFLSFYKASFPLGNTFPQVSSQVLSERYIPIKKLHLHNHNQRPGFTEVL